MNYNTFIKCEGIGAKCRLFEQGRIFKEGSPDFNQSNLPDFTQIT